MDNRYKPILGLSSEERQIPYYMLSYHRIEEYARFPDISVDPRSFLYDNDLLINNKQIKIIGKHNNRMMTILN